MRQRLKAESVPPRLNCPACKGTKLKTDLGGIRVRCDCAAYYDSLDKCDNDSVPEKTKHVVDRRSKHYKEAKAKLMKDCDMTADEAHDEIVKAAH